MNIKFKMSTICRKSNADTTDCFLNANFGDKMIFCLKLISTKKFLVILSRRNENTNLMF